jgi:hypothetical protein
MKSLREMLMVSSNLLNEFDISVVYSICYEFNHIRSLEVWPREEHSDNKIKMGFILYSS